jgi:hypothetical protein
MKRAIKLIASEDTYRDLSLFSEVAHLNKAVRMHREQHELNKTELAVLDILAQYSCKYVGVSFLTKTNIGALVGKSRRTIIRVCNRLETLGIIVQHEIKRATDMQQTSNAIVIMPVEAADTQEQRKNVTPISTTPIKTNNTIKDTATPANALKGSLPKEIYQAMSRYFNAEEIYEYYGILLRAKRSISHQIIIEDCPIPFVEAFNACVLKRKQGKIGNFRNYLYNAFQAATSRANRIMMRDNMRSDMAWIGAL